MDEEAPKPAGYRIGQDLAAMSIEELEEQIAVLEAEAARLGAAIAAKRKTADLAASIFRKRDDG